MSYEEDELDVSSVDDLSVDEESKKAPANISTPKRGSKMRVNTESATKSGVEQELKGYAKIINGIKVHPSILGCFVP